MVLGSQTNFALGKIRFPLRLSIVLLHNTTGGRRWNTYKYYKNE